MKTIRIIICSIFCVFAGLQYNDPDPYIWIPIYLLAAYIVYNYIEFSSVALISLALFLFLWALSVFPDQWEGVMLNTAGMKTINIELGRESLGLGLVSIIFLVFSIIRRA